MSSVRHIYAILFMKAKHQKQATVSKFIYLMDVILYSMYKSKQSQNVCLM